MPRFCIPIYTAARHSNERSAIFDPVSAATGGPLFIHYDGISGYRRKMLLIDDWLLKGYDTTVFEQILEGITNLLNHGFSIYLYNRTEPICLSLENAAISLKHVDTTHQKSLISPDLMLREVSIATGIPYDDIELLEHLPSNLTNDADERTNMRVSLQEIQWALAYYDPTFVTNKLRNLRGRLDGIELSTLTPSVISAYHYVRKEHPEIPILVEVTEVIAFGAENDDEERSEIADGETVTEDGRSTSYLHIESDTLTLNRLPLTIQPKKLVLETAHLSTHIVPGAAALTSLQTVVIKGTKQRDTYEFLPAIPPLTSLCFEHCDLAQIASLDTAKIAPLFATTERLSFKDCSVEPLLLARLLALAPNLKSLSLKRCGNPILVEAISETAPLSCLSSLRSLCIQNTRITPSAIDSILSQTTKLEELEISSSVIAEHDAIDRDITSPATRYRLPYLRTLSLDKTQVSSKLLANLVLSAVNLVRLDLFQCHTWHAYDLDFDSLTFHLPKLSTISACHSQLDPRFSIAILKAANALTQVSLPVVHGFSIPHTTHLKELILEPNKIGGDLSLDMVSAGQSYPAIEKLVITHYAKLTTEPLLPLLRHLKKLTVYNCNLRAGDGGEGEADETSDVALWNAIATAPHLKTLVFQGSIEWPMISPPSELYFAKLEHLTLSTNTALSPIVFSHLLGKAKNLKFLSLKCTTPLSIPEDMPLEFPKLRHLRLNRVESSENIARILRGSPQLQLIQVYRLSNALSTFTIDELKRIVRLSPELSDLSINHHTLGLYSEYVKFLKDEPECKLAKLLLSSLNQHKTDLPAPLALRVDAAPLATVSHFVVKRHFYSASGKHPPIEHYRLHTFNTVRLNPSICTEDDAFTLTNVPDARQLVTCLSGPYTIQGIPDNNELSLPPGKKGEYSFVKGYFSEPITNQWQALPSLSPNERITHLKIAPKDADLIQLAYSLRDNLYYIRTGKPSIHLVEFEFLVRIPVLAPAVLPRSITILSGELKRFYPEPRPLVLPTEACTGKTYLDTMYKQRIGACRHRVVVFLSLVQPLLPPGYRVRGVLNGCHAFVEISQDGSAWTTLDFGGYPSPMTIKDGIPRQRADHTSVGISSLTPSLGVLAAMREARFPPYRYSQVGETETAPLLPDSLSVEKKRRVKRLLAQATGSLLTETSVPVTICRDVGKKILLQTHNSEDSLTTIQQLELQCSALGRAVFFADSPSQLSFKTPHIRREGDRGQVSMDPGGELFDFFVTHKGEAPVLIINCSGLTKREIIDRNTIFEGQLDGIPIPKDTLIVAITNTSHPNAYKELDFLSRFDSIKTLRLTHSPSSVIPLESAAAEAAEPLIIDLFDGPDWEQGLIGGWQLDISGLIYVQGPLQRALSERRPLIILRNAADDERLRTLLARARTNRYIQIAGERFPFDTEVRFSKGYDWNQLKTALMPYPKDDKTLGHTLNSSNLDTLFGEYHVDAASNSLHKDEGLLARHRSGVLQCYVTSLLPASQWAKLLSKALEYGVTLQIRLGPTVRFTTELAAQFDKETLALYANPGQLVLDPRGVNKTAVLRCQDVELQLALAFKGKHSIVVDVSEMNSAELLSSIKGHYDASSQRYEFFEEEGIITKALHENKRILLHGHLSETLTICLTDFLLKRIQDERAEGKLLIIYSSETKDPFPCLPRAHKFVAMLSPRDSAEKKETLLREEFGDECLSTLPPDYLQMPIAKLKTFCRYLKAGIDNDPWVGLETAPLAGPEESELPADAHEQAMAFLTNRREGFYRLLRHSPIVYLTGLTGCGKSTFLHNELSKGTRAYFGLNTLVDWARDISAPLASDSAAEEDYIILVLDEANILTEGHKRPDYSTLSGLFLNPPLLVLDNNLYELTLRHRVIFAGNPMTTGGTRHIPKLISKHGGCLWFEPLPPSVTHEEVLKPLLLACACPPEALITISKRLIFAQQWLNKRSGSIIISPRELITLALLTQQAFRRLRLDTRDLTNHFINLIMADSVPSEHRTVFAATFPCLPGEHLHYPITDVEEEAEEEVEEARTSKFLVTPSRHDLAFLLNEIIQLRELRRSYHERTPRSSHNDILLYGGLGGLHIEGEPGIGKSQLVREVLSQARFRKTTIEEDLAEENHYYEMPASLASREKEVILRKAFDEGAFVIADEVSPSLELLLNSLLSGITPEGDRPTKPGFFFIGTSNGTSAPGKQKASDAEKRRTIHYKLTPYPEEELRAILLHRGLEPGLALFLTQEYPRAISEAHAAKRYPPCFRDLLRIAEQLCSRPKKAVSKGGVSLPENWTNLSFTRENGQSRVRPRPTDATLEIEASLSPADAPPAAERLPKRGRLSTARELQSSPISLG